MLTLLISVGGGAATVVQKTALNKAPAPPTFCAADCMAMDCTSTQSITKKSCWAGCNATEKAQVSADDVDEYCHSLPAGTSWDLKACKSGASALAKCTRCTAGCSAMCNSKYDPRDVAYASCERGCRAQDEMGAIYRRGADDEDEFCHTLELHIG